MDLFLFPWVLSKLPCVEQILRWIHRLLILEFVLELNNLNIKSVLQNWKVLNAFESNVYAIVKFTRKLIISEDKQNDCEIGKFLL